MPLIPLKRMQGEVVALIAGAVLPLAFAPFHFFAFAIFSLTALFLVLRGQTAGRAAWRAWLFGLGMYGAGVSWVFVSIHTFGNVPLALSLFLTALFVAFMALFPALCGYLLGRYASRTSALLALLVIFPAAWMLQEWVRGWFLTGFPWLSVGYSQIDGPLVGYASLIGVYGVSWIAAITAGAFAYYFSPEARCQRKTGAMLFAVTLWLVGYAAYQVEWVSPAGKPITAALVQGDIGQDMKWLPEVRDKTIELYKVMTRPNFDSDLVIWPETAIPDFYHRAQEDVEAFGEEARANGVALLAGVLYYDFETEKYYNAMVSLAGAPRFYFKQHLVPFTEYLPLKWLLGDLVAFMQVPMSDFTAGDAKQPLLEGAGYKIGVSICFEDAFGEEVIRVLPEAALLVNVSNDAWFAGSIAPYQHLQMAQMRAVESGRPMLRATNTGATAIFDHQGKQLGSIPLYEEGVLKHEVQPMQGMTPYAHLGNAPAVLGAMLALLIAGLIARKRRVDEASAA